MSSSWDPFLQFLSNSNRDQQRIYLREQLKRTGIDRVSLIQFYCACIRSVLEYASQAFHSSLPGYLSDQIERIQKRTLSIVYPELSYSEALADTNLMSRCERREHLCITLLYYIKDSGILSGNKLIKTIRYPHTWRYRWFHWYQVCLLNCT